MTITLATFFTSAARAFPVPLLPFFEGEFGISHSVAAWIVAASSLSLMASIPMGYISDRYGRKWMIIPGMVLISIATFISGFSRTAGQLIAFQFLLGIGYAAFIPSSSAIIGDIFPSAMRARAMSITLIGIFSGIAAGFLMGGMLLDTVGWRAAFFLIAVFIIAFAFVVLKIIEEPMKEHLPQRSPLSGGGNTIYLCTFILGMVGEGVRTMSPLYMAQYQIGNESIGIILAAMTVASLIILPFAGWLADKIGRKRPIIYGFLFSAPIISSFSMVTSSYQLAAVLALLGAVVGLSFPAASAYAQDSSSEIRGAAMGIYHTSRVAGMTVSPVLGGMIADRIGIGTAFNLYAFAALIGALITVTLLKDNRQSRRLYKMSNVKLDNQLLAERYDQVSEGQFKNGLILIEKLGVKPGDTVLDVGCGTGRLTLHVAGITGPGGRVVGIDPSVQRIEVAQRKIRDTPLPNVSFEIGNSNDLYRFEDNSFDIVYLNIVLHWIQEKEDALAQIYRVLKPGGRLGITTGNKDKPYTVKSIIDEVLLRPRYAGAVDAEKQTSKPMNMSELETLLEDAGFKIIEINCKKDPRYFETPLKCIEYVEASLFGNFLSNVPENLRESVKSDIMTELEKRRTSKGIENVYNTVFAVAEK